MKRIIAAIATSVLLAACSAPSFDPSSVDDATRDQVTRVEPLSWWVGMKTDLQLLIQGSGISDYDVTIESLKHVAGSLQLCDNPRLRQLEYRRINFLNHRYFMLYRIVDNVVFVDNIFHDLQDYENKIR